MRQIITHSAQLGQIIASRRKAFRHSQRALAAKLAISQNRLSEIESSPGTLTVDRLLELANVLGLELLIRDKPRASDKTKMEW